jgi:hypothetical protein
MNKKIGLLIGREWSWPSAFIAEVNKRDAGVTAEFVKLGGTFIDEPCDYAVIIDRMSHEIPYYRNYLKYAALHGAYLINNPFNWSADDKFFGVALAQRMGLKTPRTVMLPNKRVHAENVPESFRNLVYPMDWQGIIDYVGVPAILKDVHTGGRRVARRVHNVDELIEGYDDSDTLTVVLQQVIESDSHIHCFVIGKEKTMLARYCLEEKRYLPELELADDKLKETIEAISRRLCAAYDYDLNMVEFVIHEGEPVLINPSNPAPQIDIKLLTPRQFAWCVNEAANLAIAKAQDHANQFTKTDWYAALVE